MDCKKWQKVEYRRSGDFMSEICEKGQAICSPDISFHLTGGTYHCEDSPILTGTNL